MGFDPNTCRFLIAARKRGVDFSSSVTLGRQWLMTDAGLLKHMLRDVDRLGSDESQEACGGFSDSFLRTLGSTDLHAIDASDYEQADLIHDMNLPIPESLKSRFDAVIDGGTLEHVFNFPTAIKNAMEMTKVGGHLFLFTPSNNYFGHGFYQFSAELFFRVLSKQNGFHVERIIATEMGNDKWFEVKDPDKVKRRGAVVNKLPLLLMVQARRTAERPIFQTPPQQSDYVESWNGNTAPSTGDIDRPGVYGRLRDGMRGIIPASVRMFARRFFWEPIRGPVRHRHLSLHNRLSFTPIDG